jgi:hypothetical protein
VTVGAKDGTKVRYAFVHGDFRRVHRMGLIACSYGAAEWRHKEVEITADELLQYLDTECAPQEALIVPADAGRSIASVSGDIDAMMDRGQLPAADHRLRRAGLTSVSQ